MTIECYYHECPCHADNNDSGEGPFCTLEDCAASDEELQLYRNHRELYLVSKGLPPDFDGIQGPTKFPHGRWPLYARLFWLSYAALMAVAIGTIFFMFTH